MEDITRDELDGIRSRCVNLANAMALAAGRFDTHAKAYIGLANAADRLDRILAKDEGEELLESSE
jgi:hypothetical protein